MILTVRIDFQHQQELQDLKIELQHRNRIWRALVEYRNRSMSTASVVDSPQYQQHAYVAPSAILHDSPEGASGDDGLDYSVGCERARLTSAAVSAPNGTAVVDSNGRVYDVMRFTYRHKVLLKEEDHNYC